MLPECPHAHTASVCNGARRGIAEGPCQIRRGARYKELLQAPVAAVLENPLVQPWVAGLYIEPDGAVRGRPCCMPTSCSPLPCVLHLPTLCSSPRASCSHHANPLFTVPGLVRAKSWRFRLTRTESSCRGFVDGGEALWLTRRYIDLEMGKRNNLNSWPPRKLPSHRIILSCQPGDDYARMTPSAPRIRETYICLLSKNIPTPL